MTKTCRTCLQNKDIELFHYKPDCSMGVSAHCKDCKNSVARSFSHTARGRKAKAAWCKKYEKTLNGYVMRQYRNMKSRVRGVQKKKAHLYKGLEIMPKMAYYKLCLTSPLYKTMFYNYRKSGWLLSLAPTPDRIDSSLGYVDSNIQFVTQSVNSSRTSRGG